MRIALAVMPLVVGLGVVGWLALRPASERHAQASALESPRSPSAQILQRRIAARGQLGPGRGTLVIAIEPPPSSKLTAGAPLAVEARGEHLSFPETIKRPLDPEKLPIRLPIDVTDGALGPAYVKLSFYWCVDGNAAACRPERVELRVDLDLSGDAPGGEAFFIYRADPEPD
jgi:hypothetical protein